MYNIYIHALKVQRNLFSHVGSLCLAPICIQYELLHYYMSFKSFKGGTTPLKTNMTNGKTTMNEDVSPIK